MQPQQSVNTSREDATPIKNFLSMPRKNPVSCFQGFWYSAYGVREGGGGGGVGVVVGWGEGCGFGASEM